MSVFRYDRLLLCGGAAGMTVLILAGLYMIYDLSILGIPIPPALTAFVGAFVGSLITLLYSLMIRTQYNGDRKVDKPDYRK